MCNIPNRCHYNQVIHILIESNDNTFKSCYFHDNNPKRMARYICQTDERNLSAITQVVCHSKQTNKPGHTYTNTL